MRIKRDNFWLDGEDCAAHNIVLQKEIEFDSPEPVMESYKIAGTDRNAVYYDGSYKNVKGIAKCYILSNDVSFDVTSANAWLLSVNGYRRLQTMHEPNFYRLAIVNRGIKLNQRINKVNPFEIEFDCYPYKYFLDGEEPIEINLSDFGTVGYKYILGPSSFESFPLIVVHGSGAGTLTVNNASLSLTDSNETVLDSELKKAYRGSTNMNSTVSGTYPLLRENNTVSFSGGITSITLTPRWRTL